MSQAITHLLRQIQRDGRLAYLIGPMSQTYELLTKEAAEAAGEDVATFRKNFEATLTFTEWPSDYDIQYRIEVAVEADRRTRQKQ